MYFIYNIDKKIVPINMLEFYSQFTVKLLCFIINLQMTFNDIFSATFDDDIYIIDTKKYF